MSAIVFCGPTVSAPTVLGVLEDAEVLPPVAQGDVYRAALQRPRAIGIIDGYFERVPSVWHKEILWAMSRGIHVYGAASMGALRAAELETFGMVGVGAIFEAYRDGALEDDDEVAVVHGTKESRFEACSDALVNIRATLRKAVEVGVIGPELEAALVRTAKSLFYPERTYERVIELVEPLHREDLASLRSWLRGNEVNQKVDDALAMLRVMRDRSASDRTPKTVSYKFEATLHWEALLRSSGEAPFATKRDDAAVLEVLSRDEAALEMATRAATALHLATEWARERQIEVDASATEQWAADLCRRFGLENSRQVDHWLADNRLSRRELRRILDAQAYLDWARQSAGSAIEARLLDHLRWTGEYASLLERSRRS